MSKKPKPALIEPNMPKKDTFIAGLQNQWNKLTVKRVINLNLKYGAAIITVFTGMVWVAEPQARAFILNTIDLSHFVKKSEFESIGNERYFRLVQLKELEQDLNTHFESQNEEVNDLKAIVQQLLKSEARTTALIETLSDQSLENSRDIKTLLRSNNTIPFAQPGIPSLTSPPVMSPVSP